MLEAFTADELVPLFNKWMAEFIADPAAFQAEFQSVNRFQADLAAGEVPSYGHQAVSTLLSMREAG